jgi:hypothetical protein
MTGVFHQIFGPVHNWVSCTWIGLAAYTGLVLCYDVRCSNAIEPQELFSSTTIWGTTVVCAVIDGKVELDHITLTLPLLSYKVRGFFLSHLYFRIYQEEKGWRLWFSRKARKESGTGLGKELFCHQSALQTLSQCALLFIKSLASSESKKPPALKLYDSLIPAQTQYF